MTASRQPDDSDDSLDDETLLLGGVSPEEVHDPLPTADELGRGLLGDRSE